MPATLSLLPRKQFEITLADGTVISGRYNTWAIKRFCDKKKITFNELTTMGADKFTIDILIELVLAAVESVARKEKKPFSYTDFDVCEWLDEFGGLGAPEVGSLFAHMNQEEDLQADTSAEKKTVDGSLSGENSNEISTQQVAQ